MKYGEGSYKLIDGIQRTGDFFRSAVRGRYKIINDGDKAYVTRRYLFSKKDVPLEEKDFAGITGGDNNRLLRKLEKYFNNGNKPKKMYFHVDNEKYGEKDSAEIKNSALNMFKRGKYRKIPVRQFKKRVEIGEKVSKYGFPILAVTTAILKTAGRQKGIDLDVPLETAQFKTILNGIGNLTGLGTLICGAAGSSFYVTDANVERYKHTRKKMRNANIEF